ncbi:MAG: 16S rRNA (uracil(1498)-N(3))-methyltransferase [Deltaproteobacteria bacterium]|nr:16S rRNA (uracil(1498)-N(3))-methyltransferase [Deltaproteobacteria bacterium]
MSFGRIKLSGAAIGGAFDLREEAFRALMSWNPRMKEAVTVVSNDALFRARIESLGEDSARLKVFEEMGPIGREIDITLLQALPEKERMELIIQKTTELGVASIIPFKSEKSISIDERDSAQKKSHRWQAAALKAAKQSRRPDIPSIEPFCAFEDALRVEAGLKIMLWEKGGLPSLKGVLRGYNGPGPVALLSGPEGGFTDEEAEAAKGAGFVPVSLGNRILRAETSAIAAVGIIGYEMIE